MRRERRANGGCCLGGNVGQRVAPDQRAERGRAHQYPAKNPEPRSGDMNEHDFHRRALLIIVGREIGGNAADGEAEHGGESEPGQ